MRPGSPTAWMGGGPAGVWVATPADVDVVLVLLGRSPTAEAVADVLRVDVASGRVHTVLELLQEDWELPCSAC